MLLVLACNTFSGELPSLRRVGQFVYVDGKYVGV